ncbi:MAG: hypothetical protein ACI8RZ_001590 [Myxococcota bacterium]|jgi:hypothetical protein
MSKPPPQPTGLLALLLLPLQAILTIGLQLFAALMQGILGAFIPKNGDNPSEGEEE